MLAAVRNFVIAFLIAAAVFGSIAWFITGFIAENVIGIAESPEDTGVAGPETPPSVVVPPIGNQPETPTYDDLDGSSFNILLIGTDYRPDDFNDYIEDLSNGKYDVPLGFLEKPVRTQNADVLLLVTVSEETRQITFTLIPTNTRVSVNGAYYLLGTRYDKGGCDELVDFVSFLTAVPIDYYIKVNVTDAGSIIDVIGGVEMNVPRDVINPYYNPDMTKENAPYSGISGDRDFETEIMIEAGDCLIDSSNIFGLLHYRTNGGSAAERTSVLSILARKALEKAVGAEYLPRAAELFSTVVKYAETNMKVGDLTANLGILSHYSEFTVTTLEYPGTTSMLGTSECFIPSLNEAYAMYRSYRGQAQG